MNDPGSGQQGQFRSASREPESRGEGAARSTAPLVSVGVFLYNEGRFVANSLESLIGQDYPNLEIVVSDNCSTDDTSSICRTFAERDQRIAYERLENNIGAAANSVRVLERASGEYFMWASGHDLWSPGFVTACVAELERHPDAALAYGPAEWIDAHGLQQDRESGWYDTRGLAPIARLFTAFWGNLHPVLGVIRTQFLKELPKIHACAGSDQIVLAQLALAGEFIHVPMATWSRRDPRGQESHTEKIERYTSKEFGLAGSWLDRAFPLLRLPLEISRAVWTSRIGLGEKLAALLALPPAYIVRYLAARHR